MKIESISYIYTVKQEISLDYCLSRYEKAPLTKSTKDKVVADITILLRKGSFEDLSENELISLHYLSGIYLYLCEVLDENNTHN